MASNIKSSLKTEWTPAIVSWNRVEGRPRKDNFERTLRAEVRDPLWMLTRQWQFGEFKGQDAGSPVFARTQIRTSRLTRYRGHADSTSDMDSSIPLEARVEQQSVTIDLAESVRMGNYWRRLLRKSLDEGHLARDYRNDYVVLYPIETPPADADHAAVHAHSEVHQWYAATSGRSMDGLAFHTHLSGSGRADGDLPSLDPADASELEALGDLFLHWMDNHYQQPSGDESNDWVPERLEYSFACSAPTEEGGETVLTADGHHGGRLDWYSFDVDPAASGLGDGEDHLSALGEDTVSFIPAPIQFAGMPNPRWWEFEDRRVDLGNVDAHTTDTAKLLLTEFSIIYGNDWFLIPYRLASGSLARVTGLEVTNNFGERTWIEAAGSRAEDTWQRWTMYTLSDRSGNSAADTRLFLPGAVGKALEGEPIEEVHLIRDEMANMVWAVEARIPLDHGVGKPGHKAALDTRGYFEAITPKDLDTSELKENDARIQYRLQTQVPENWIPLIPVHVDGSSRKTQLQRSSMLRYLDQVSSSESIPPRTETLSGPPSPYYIHEEEVPRAGAEVRRTFQRCRWHDGRVALWLGLRKRTGRGENSSGLRFDQIREKPQA